MSLELEFNPKADGTEATSDWELIEVSEVSEFEFDNSQDTGKGRRRRPIATLVLKRNIAGIIDAEAAGDLLVTNEPFTAIYSGIYAAGAPLDPGGGSGVSLEGSYIRAGNSYGEWTLISDGIYQQGVGSLAMEHRTEWQCVGAWSAYDNDESAGS